MAFLVINRLLSGPLFLSVSCAAPARAAPAVKPGSHPRAGGVHTGLARAAPLLRSGAPRSSSESPASWQKRSKEERWAGAGLRYPRSRFQARRRRRGRCGGRGRGCGQRRRWVTAAPPPGRPSWARKASLCPRAHDGPDGGRCHLTDDGGKQATGPGSSAPPACDVTSPSRLEGRDLGRK